MTNFDGGPTPVAASVDVRRTIDLDPIVLLQAMPVAMFIIDRSAKVVFINERLLEMIGRTSEEVVGSSALDFIDERDIEFVSGLLVMGPEYDGSMMGPMRVRYLDVLGVSHFTQVWAYEAPKALGIDGYIVTLTPESVRDVLASAVTSVASDQPLDRTLAAVAMAGRAMPLDGIGSILLVEPSAPTDQDRFRVVGDWPIDRNLVNAFGTPWRRCLVQNEPQDVLDASFGVDARTGAEMAMAKLPAAWVRPIADDSGDVGAVFIVWRRNRTAVSPNQEQHIGEAIRLAHLALEQAQHRRELEFAAHRDALTGVGNRASLNDRIELSTVASNVLFIDLDQFKAVNDTFGHAVGDEVIAQAGRRIAEAVRRGDDVYRTGGDEFVVLCDPAADDVGLKVLSERLIDRLAAPFDCREHRIRIGATIGVAKGRPHPEVQRSLRDTIAAADRAMYVAKERGRGCVHYADAVR